MSYQRLPEHEDGPAAPSAAEAELTPLPSAPPAEEVKKDAACEPEDGLTPVTIMQLGRPNLTFRVDLSWTVADLKRRAFPVEAAEGKSIRLVAAGRELADPQPLRAFNIAANQFIQAVIGPPRAQAQADAQNAQRDGEEGELDGRQLPPWMLREAQLAAAMNADPPQGTFGDFILGFFMGFVLNIIAITCLFMRDVPRRQKIGIVCGIIMYEMQAYAIRQRS